MSTKPMSLLPAVVVGIAALCTCGCTTRDTVPVEGTMPSVGLLVRTASTDLSWNFQLRRHELLISNISNDFYPANVAAAKHEDTAVPRLYRRSGMGWTAVDFVEMPDDDHRGRRQISPDGRRILYERPTITAGEGKYPRQHARDRRVYSVAIYDQGSGQRHVLECYGEVYSAGSASLWRRDGEAVAFTTTNQLTPASPRELVVLDGCGEEIISARTLPGLAGLEFICWSPDGKRLAALAPSQASCGGAKGGTLMELDPKARALREVGWISDSQACPATSDLQRLVGWNKSGQAYIRTE